MPRRSKPGSQYPANWKEIAKRVKDEHNWTCVRCGAAHNPPQVIMTVHHLDMDPGNNVWWNLCCLCARCHLSVQSRVVLERPWRGKHKEWFRPYVAGYYAWKYLGMAMTRAEVLGRIDFLLTLEDSYLRGG